MEDRARRQQGAHYTSERDIMKVLRSLFLDELRAELHALKADRSTRRRAGLESFHEKLRSLQLPRSRLRLRQFPRPRLSRTAHAGDRSHYANFTARSSRRLDVRRLRKVDVDQFHGIEYSEWPVRIAEVALWLMDHQMNAQAAEAFGQGFDRLPLRASPHIVQGNALRVDWNEVLPRENAATSSAIRPSSAQHFRTQSRRPTWNSSGTM